MSEDKLFGLRGSKQYIAWEPIDENVFSIIHSYKLVSLLSCFHKKEVNWEERKKRKESKLGCSFPSWPSFPAVLLSGVKGPCQ